MARHHPHTTTMTMTPGTAAKVVAVSILLILGIVCVLRMTMHLTHKQTQHAAAAAAETETFANPTAPPIADVSDRQLAAFDADMRTSVGAIYDPYYADVYYKLFDMHKHKMVLFECHDLYDVGRFKEYGSKVVLLDVGCGTGSHLKCLAGMAPKATLYGLDQSADMLRIAEKRLRAHSDRVHFIEGDFNNTHAVYAKMFTHVTCYFFSFYYAQNPKRFFDNAHTWLKTAGHLCVYLVDPKKFDPIPYAANPIKGISIQRYMKTRRTDARVFFKSFVYRSDFKYNEKKNRATLTESFIYPKKRAVRYHTHDMIMPPHEAVIKVARNCGFRLRHLTRLQEIGQTYEYLCYFQKR
jgi:ubiquinone/menaquinone biosynthesis C-methylase UbiE